MKCLFKKYLQNQIRAQNSFSSTRIPFKDNESNSSSLSLSSTSDCALTDVENEVGSLIHNFGVNDPTDERYKFFLADLVKNNRMILNVQKNGNIITTPNNHTYKIIKRPFEKPYESTYECVRPLEPLHRISDQFKPMALRKTKFVKPGFSAFYDIVIIGGGIMGCSIAYWINATMPGAFNMCVIERDPSYSDYSPMMSINSLKQQFAHQSNVSMSLFGADFFRHLDKFLYVHNQPLPSVKYQPHGVLYLADDKGAEDLEAQYLAQIECGARVEMLSKANIKRRFPWLNVDGITVGSYGTESEGWIDSMALLQALRLKLINLGTDFVHGEVYNMAHQINEYDKGTDENEEPYESRLLFNQLREVHVELTDGDVFPINSAMFILAASHQTGHIAHLAGVGSGTGLLKVPLPIVPRKRFTYKVHCPTGPGLNCPLVVDSSGLFFRRSGYNHHYLVGRAPSRDEDEPSIDNLDVDPHYFNSHIQSHLVHRVPAFKESHIVESVGRFVDVNLHDQLPIIGTHPHHNNLYFAAGFNGDGLQQSPAIGKALAELMYEQEYKTFDLYNLDFNRILRNNEFQEKFSIYH